MVLKMKEDSLLERQQAIMEEIIQFYLSRHEAISARTLSKISRLALSPTTIRNLMEDLSHDGFLTSEGVSRGRIPTQKAFTIYVTNLRPVHGGLPPSVSAVEIEEEEEPPTLPAALAKLGGELAEQSGFIAMASLPEKDRYPLDWVKLVNIQPGRLMVAVQSLFGDLWCKVVRAADPLPDEVLEELESYLCLNYHGAPMEKVRGDILSATHIPLLEESPSLGGAFRLLRKAFEWDKAPGWQVWGREHLYRISEYQQPEQLVKLHRALENPNLLERVLAGGRSLDGGLVSIGTETAHDGLESSSVVGYPFADGGGWQGMLGVLGPMRMDYGLILGMVSNAAAALRKHLRHLRNRGAPCG